LWGQFVGDAAGLGTHWIYDLSDMARRFPGGVYGFETPGSGHYHEGKKSGDQTHYGDAALLVLESVAACGEFREADFGMRLEAFFSLPGCITYRDNSTRDTLAHLEEEPDNYQNGAIDDEPATVTRLAPVVVAYTNREPAALADAIRRLTLVTQNHPTALVCAAASAELLRHLLTGMPFREAFELGRKSSTDSYDASDYFELAYTRREEDVISATDYFGKSCPLSESFPAALHAAWRHHDNFAEAVLATIHAGGDNAGRAAMVGSWLGACLGVESIPPSCIERLSERERIQSAIDQLLTRCIDQKPG
ncbi:MAG: ADP-ribosylglycohydrolase family protein, partial [Prosthecobacter sp.]|nr:ADP-ribosylglycohydrolase family protein [Prosthecobacter sp.]